jgi:hypothetical protein
MALTITKLIQIGDAGLNKAPYPVSRPSRRLLGLAHHLDDEE